MSTEPIDIDKHLEGLIRSIRCEIESERDLIMARFHLLSATGLDIVVTPFHSDHDEHAAHRQVMKIAAERNAYAIFSVSEVYGIPEDKKEEFMAGILSGKWRSVEQYPERIDGVLFVLETALGTSVGEGIITVAADGARTLGEVKMRSGRGNGRFMNMLRPTEKEMEA